MSVADLLVPNPYPLNLGPISSASLTVGALAVTDALGAGTITVQTTSAEPINVNNTSATTENDVTFYNSGVRTASFGVNNMTNEAYAWTHPEGAADLKFGTSGIARVVIGSGGIMPNENATQALCQTTPGGTVLWQRTLDGGSYSPAYSGLGGFGTLSGAAGIWSRNGNTVTVTVTLLSLQVVAASAQAAVSLPVPPAANFTIPENLIGTATHSTSAVMTSAAITARVGTLQALIDVTASANFTSDFHASFMYRIA